MLVAEVTSPTPARDPNFQKMHAVAGLVLRLLLAGNPKIHRIGPQRYCHGSSCQTSSTLLSETPTSEYRDDDNDKTMLRILAENVILFSREMDQSQIWLL